MKQLIALLALTTVLAGPAARAEDFPHLEFARGLRARNFPDLALDYLTKLSAEAKLPPAVARLLPLEMARSTLDLTLIESDPERRTALYHQARQQLERFIAANPRLAEAAPAHLDVARIAVYQAKNAYAQAQQQEGPSRSGALKAVRGQLEEAGRQLQLAKQRIAVAGAGPAVHQAATEADLEINRNLLDQALTYDIDRESLPRSELVKKALLGLKTLAKQECPSART